MRLAFLHIDIPGKEECRALAEIMVRSAQRVMPDVEIVQLTELKTKRIEGVDTVIRKRLEYPWIMLYRLDHFRSLDGDSIFIDTDAVIQKDPRVVFEKEFDVALTRRTGRIFVDGKDIVPTMPYNSGVMFSRGPKFWHDCFKHCSTLSDAKKNWFGDQEALKVVVDSGKYNVHELTCDEFNYSPDSPDEDFSGRYILHMKGARKAFMPQVAARILKKEREAECAF